MARKEPFFKPARNRLGGYYIPVRNDWNYHIKRRHLSEEQSELFQEKFGEKIIMESEFLDWYINYAVKEENITE